MNQLSTQNDISLNALYQGDYLANSTTMRFLAPLIVRYLRTHVAIQGRLLDAGCGDGGVLRELLKNFGARFTYEGVDALEDSQRMADPLIRFYRRDLNANFSLEPAAFDCIISCEVVEHVIDTDHFIRNISELLKPGGHLILTTPNLGSLFNRLLLLFGLQPLHTEVSWQNPYLGRAGLYKMLGVPQLPAAGHLRLFTHKALLEFLRFHGYVVVKRLGFSPYEGALGAISRCFGCFPSLMPGLFVVAQKT